MNEIEAILGGLGHIVANVLSANVGVGTMVVVLTVAMIGWRAVSGTARAVWTIGKAASLFGRIPGAFFAALFLSSITTLGYAVGDLNSTRPPVVKQMSEADAAFVAWKGHYDERDFTGDTRRGTTLLCLGIGGMVLSGVYGLRRWTLWHNQYVIRS